MCLQCGRPGFDPWVGKIPWRRVCNPFQYSHLENLHGQRSLACYSLWGRKELDTTERLSTQHHTQSWGDCWRIRYKGIWVSLDQKVGSWLLLLLFSPSGSSVPGTLQAIILEWVAISFSRGSSQPRDQTCISCIGRRWQVNSLPLSHQGSPLQATNSLPVVWIWKEV